MIKTAFFFRILVVLLVTISRGYAQIDNRSLVLKQRNSLILLTEEYSEIEKEFETSTRIVDESYSSGFISSLKYFHKTKNNQLQFGAGVSYLKHGKNDSSVDKNLNLPKTRQREIYHIGNPFFEIIKNIKVIDHSNHYLKAKYIFPMAKKEHLYFDERDIALLAYIYSYSKMKGFEVSTKLYTRYYGEIKTGKHTLGREVREPFTEVGFSFYPTFHFDHFHLIPLVGFSFSTDYNTHNQYFSRLTDKGFSYYGGAELQYTNKNYLISLEYYSSSFVFNSISENPDNNIDNEIEKRSIKVSVGVSL